MKVRKGEITMFISPNQWLLYKQSGWKRVQEHSKEKIKQYNETQRLKRLSKEGDN